MEYLELLEKYSGALTAVFTLFVTVATVVYAVLTYILVSETRRMRMLQTEPKLQVTVRSLDEAIHIVRLHIKNIGMGPAQNIKFSQKVLSGGQSASDLITEFTSLNYFKIGLSYLGPGEERYSNFTQINQNHDAKIASVIEFKMKYKGTSGKQYEDIAVIDMSELKDTYKLGKDSLYSIANSIEKIQKDLNRITSGMSRVRSDVYTDQDRKNERQESERRRQERENEHSPNKSTQRTPLRFTNFVDSLRSLYHNIRSTTRVR